ELIKADARLDIRAVSNPQKFDSEEQARAAIGTDTDKEVLPYRERKADGTADTGYYIVDKSPVITGSDVREARGQQNQQGMGGYSVGFTLKPSGAGKFGDWTEKNVGNYLAVVLNGEIKSVAVVKSKISDSGQIEGSFTKDQAEDLGLTL